MSKRILICCVIFSSAILLFVGYKNQSKATSERKINRAKLMFDLESYMSPEEVRQHLGPNAISWKIEEESNINNVNTHSSDNYYSVLVKNFSFIARLLSVIIVYISFPAKNPANNPAWPHPPNQNPAYICSLSRIRFLS